MNESEFSTQEIEKYENYYSESSLMDKLKNFAKKAGLKAVYAALLLYYVLKNDEVPQKEKALILGALGYLILPIDLIPDAIPVLGFTDDFAALLYAIHSVRQWITEPIKEQTKVKLLEWFDSIDEKELSEVLA